MRTVSLSVFFLVYLLLAPISYAQSAPPKVPDPFCAPSEFFKYLNAGNRERVLYVVKNCTNIDLREKGPKGEKFMSILARYGWNDIFALVLNRTDVDYQGSLKELLVSDRFEWLLQLENVTSLKYTVDDRSLLISGYPNSKDLIQVLIANKKIDPNQAGAAKRNMLLEALEKKKFDLVEYLRRIPHVDQTQLYPQLCSYVSTGVTAYKPFYLAYFKELLRIEKPNVNFKCADGVLLAFHVISINDADLADRIFKDPQFDLSKPTVSYMMAKKLEETYRENNGKYFSAILGHPTFNFADLSADGKNLWHLLAEVRNASSAEFVAYFSKLASSGILQRDNGGRSALYYFVYSRRNIKEPISLRFLSNPEFNINQMEDEATLIVHAMIAGNRGLFEYLMGKGADTRNIGNVKMYNAHILAGMMAGKGYYDTFYKHPDLDINAFASANAGYRTLYSYLMENDPFPRPTFHALLADPRFDVKLIDSYRSSYSCNSVATWLLKEKTEEKMALFLAQHSSTESLSVRCQTWDYRKHYALAGAAALGYLDLVKYLYETKKLPVNPAEGFSAFKWAYEKKQWPVVEYFVKQGYAAEYNSDYAQALLESKRVELLKEYVKHPSFDPNIPADSWWRDFFVSISQDEFKEIFDIVIANPKLKVGKSLTRIVRYFGEDTNTYYFDKAVERFKIETQEDKEIAILTLKELAYNRWPVRYFQKIAALKNFDINLQAAEPNAYPEAKSTLFARMMTRDRVLPAEYLDYIYTLKAFNPAAVSEVSPTVRYRDLELGELPVEKKYFDLYYNHPKIKAVLPDADSVT